MVRMIGSQVGPVVDSLFVLACCLADSSTVVTVYIDTVVAPSGVPTLEHALCLNFVVWFA